MKMANPSGAATRNAANGERNVAKTAMKIGVKTGVKTGERAATVIKMAIRVFARQKPRHRPGLFSFAAASRMSLMGHSLQTHSAPVPVNVRSWSVSDQIADEAECRLSAASRHRLGNANFLLRVVSPAPQQVSRSQCHHSQVRTTKLCGPPCAMGTERGLKSSYFL